MAQSAALDLPQPIRLYDTARAPNPRRVRIFLDEKGLSLPVTDVTIMTGAHKASGYRDRAGTHHVPALELADGTMLTETVAICRYLEALVPEPALMGRDAREAAIIEMWQRRVEFQLLMPIAFVLRHGNPAMAVLESPQVAVWAEHNRPRVVDALHWLDRRLAGSEHVAGAEFSIADITAIVAVDFMRTIKQPIPEACAALSAWAARVRARPSMRP
ncbi:MAG: glutathione S-transferase [Pseudomonadota bacterium]